MTSYFQHFKEGQSCLEFINYFVAIHDNEVPSYCKDIFKNDIHIARIILEIIGDKPFERAARQKPMFLVWFQLDFMKGLLQELITLEKYPKSCQRVAFEHIATYIFKTFQDSGKVCQLYDSIHIYQKYLIYAKKDEYEKAYMQMRENIFDYNKNIPSSVK
jgi:hypothetical protein